jgi:hypothetical protein
MGLAQTLSHSEEPRQTKALVLPASVDKLKGAYFRLRRIKLPL